MKTVFQKKNNKNKMPSVTFFEYLQHPYDMCINVCFLQIRKLSPSFYTMKQESGSIYVLYIFLES